MPGITITREELVEASVDRLMRDTSLLQIIKDAVKANHAEMGMVAISTAAEMLDMDEATVRSVFGDKIVRLGPRLARIPLEAIREASRTE